jgi:hypothetical protein
MIFLCVVRILYNSANNYLLNIFEYLKYLRKEKRDSDDVTLSAKKRRIELEHQRQQAAIEEQRQLEDVRQRSKREQEDLTLQIEFHRQLEGLSSKSAFAPGLSSTLLNVAPGEDKIYLQDAGLKLPSSRSTGTQGRGQNSHCHSKRSFMTAACPT